MVADNISFDGSNLLHVRYGLLINESDDEDLNGQDQDGDHHFLGNPKRESSSSSDGVRLASWNNKISSPPPPHSSVAEFSPKMHC